MLARSFRWRVVVAVLAVCTVVILAETTLLDSRFAARLALFRVSTAPPTPGAQLRFIAHGLLQGHDHPFGHPGPLRHRGE